MNKSVVVVGMGEMGSVFARGFLRSGYSVHPVTRDIEMNVVAAKLAEYALADSGLAQPELVLIAVAEADLHQQLENIPDVWRDRIVLLQNELLPADWQKYELTPTVISVWFEKKKGRDSKVIIPSPVYGKHAQLLTDALASIDIATKVLDDEAALLQELVLKNLYILTTNIAGLQVAGNVGQLWSKHKEVANAVAADVIKLQQALSGQALDKTALINGMVKAFDGDREHMCMGRSAPGRLQRALVLAGDYNLSLPVLEKISQDYLSK